LVVVTQVKIMLFGLGFEGRDKAGIASGLRVYPSKYTTSTDKSILRKIVSTNEGRIFLCGEEGMVFEFQYEVTQNFWGEARRKVRKVNCSSSIFQNFLAGAIPFVFGGGNNPIVNLVVDETGVKTRLYALTKNGSIQVYNVPRNGGGVVKETEMADVLLKAAKSLRSNLQSTFKENNHIVGIAPITVSESTTVQLMALTRNGDRIFLQNGSFGLSVKFVRLRPPNLEVPRSQERQRFQPMATAHSPGHVGNCLHRDGVTILVDNKQADNDVLIVFSRDPISMGNPNDMTTINRQVTMSELVEKHETKNRFICIEEVPLHAYNPPILFYHFASDALKKTPPKKPLQDLSPYATQHLARPRRFIGLTQTFFVSYEFMRPVDDLALLIRNSSGNVTTEKDILTFFDTYGYVEACAMCLVIICSDPKHCFENPMLNTGSGSWVIDGAGKIFFKFGNISGGPPNIGLQAMYLYLSRIMRPVWHWTITDKQGLKRNLRHLPAQWALFQEPVLRFQTFVKSHLGEINRNQLNNSGQQLLGPDPNQTMLTQFQDLLSRCVEAFYLLQIMSDTDVFIKVRENLDPQHRKILEQIEFGQLVHSENGRELCRAYITSMIRLNLGRKHVDSLHTTCPTFFNDSVHLIFQANQIVESIKKDPHHESVRNKKRAAMDKYKMACLQPGFDLRRCCDTLREAHLFYDVVELVDYFVEKVYKERPNPKNPTPEVCYQEILSCLTIIASHKDRFMTSSGENFVPIPAAKQVPLLRSTVKRALAIQDREFLYNVYETLLKHNRLQVVFDMNPKFLEMYLRENDREQDRWKKKQAQLLSFYDATKNQLEKMTFLAQMAFGKDPKYELAKRHEFLIAASYTWKQIQNSQTSLQPTVIPDHASIIKQALESSTVQIDIHKKLTERRDTKLAEAHDEARIEELDSKLLDLNQLEDVAAETSLYSVILKIAKLQNRMNDTDCVEKAWEGIVRQQLLLAQNESASQQWLDYLAKAVQEYSKELIKRPEHMWLMPYDWLLVNVEHFDVHMNPSSTVSPRVPVMLEDAGIERKAILQAYARKLPESNNLVRDTHLRLLDVQLFYLDGIVSELMKKDKLNVSEREVVASAHALSTQLKSHIGKMIDNRDTESRMMQEASKLYDRTSELLRKVSIKERPKSLLGGARNPLNLGIYHRSSPV